jgi:hypothetical protein
MKAISAIALAVLILGAVIVSLEMSGGPLQDASGVVESVQVVPSATAGASDRIASVLLPNGKRVQARIAGNEDLRPGQAAHLRISHGVQSGEWMFEATGGKEHAK